MYNMLEYRGYLGSILYSEDDETFRGRLEFIRDLVTYEGVNAKSLKRAFRDAVDDYLTLCEEQGRRPDVPLKGSFNVRPGRELHRRAMLHASRKGMTLNAVVTNALRRMLDDPSVETIQDGVVKRQNCQVLIHADGKSLGRRS